MLLNTEGSDNTASGASALRENTTGNNNTASGRSALFSNTKGNDNTASGAFALSSNSEGIGNTASGNAALVSNTTGSYNTASGAAALFSNTTGINNTASGVNALFLSTGKDNTAIGHNAGSTLITGDNNIYVGNSGKSEESDTIRIGNSDHTIAFIAGVQVVPPSAKRFKEDIHDMDDASGDLMSLRPVTFRYKKDYASGDTRLHYGLIAEEVAEVYPELVVNDGTGRAKTVEYQKLTTMLLNELQKQHRKIEAQERRNADLMARLARLEQEQSAEVSEVLH